MTPPAREGRAGWLAETLVLLLAGAAVLVARATATGLPLAFVLLPVVALEAWGPGAPRTVRAARRRMLALAVIAGVGLAHRVGGVVETALALAAIALVARQASREAFEGEPRAIGRFVAASLVVAIAALERASADYVLAAIVAGAGAWALVPARRLSPGLERATWLLYALALVAWVHDAMPIDLAVERGRFVGMGAVGAIAVAVFFAVARATRSRERPPLPGVIAATLLSILAGAEGALRVKALAAPDRRVLELTPTPLVSHGSRALTSIAGGDLTDNRNHVFSPRKAPGTFRVVVLGGSSIYGHAQLVRETSFSGVLERLLQATLKNHTPEVLCLALPGLTSDHELGQLIGNALEWDADLFLAIDDYNDISFLAAHDSYPGDVYYWHPFRLGLEHPVQRWLIRHSMIFGRPLAPALLHPTVIRDDHYDASGLNGFCLDGLVANESSMAALAVDAGAKFAWAGVPLVYDRTVLGADSNADDVKATLAPELKRRSLECRARVGPAVIAQGGIVLDLGARIGRRSSSAPDDRWFTDVCHYTDRGMVVLAEETRDALAEAGALP